MAMTIKGDAYVSEQNVNSYGTWGKKLKTKDTYLDKDIEVIVNVPAGSHSVEAGENSVTKAISTVSTSIVGDTGVTPVVYDEKEADELYITIGGTADVTAGSISNVVTCTTTAGYIRAGAETATVSGEIGVDVTNAAPKYIKVYNGTFL